MAIKIILNPRKVSVKKLGYTTPSGRRLGDGTYVLDLKKFKNVSDIRADTENILYIFLLFTPLLRSDLSHPRSVLFQAYSRNYSTYVSYISSNRVIISNSVTVSNRVTMIHYDVVAGNKMGVLAWTAPRQSLGIAMIHARYECMLDYPFFSLQRLIIEDGVKENFEEIHRKHLNEMFGIYKNML
jgi:hypothetical protein